MKTQFAEASDYDYLAPENSAGQQSAAREDSLTAGAIQDWLVSKLCEVLGVEPKDIDVQEHLTSYGLGSIQAVSLAGDLEEWIGRDLPATLLWDYPTLETLSKHLAEEAHL